MNRRSRKDAQMKPIRFLLSAALMGLSTLAFAQSDAQKSFNQLKSLAGSWEGTMDGKPMQISLRVTSMGNALMHEMTMAGRPDDPSPCCTSTEIACF